jgi:PKD repeat protein
MKKNLPVSFLVAVLFLSFAHSSISQTTLVIQPGPSDGKDAYINSAFPDVNLYGGESNGMLVTAWTFDGVFGLGRGLVRFDLSQIPAGSTILSAKLDLNFEPNCCIYEHYGDNGWYIRKLLGPWEEHAVTWNNQPPQTTVGQIEMAPSTNPTQDFKNIEFTQFVRDWFASPASNYGFICQIKTEETYRSVTLGFSENPIPARRPALTVTYSGCQLPVAHFNWNVQYPQVTFTDSSLYATSWQWDFGDGTTSGQQNPVHNYASPARYYVCLTASNACGVSTFCDTVDLSCNSPVAGFFATTNHLEASFTDTSSHGNSWYWTFGDGIISTVQNPVHTYPGQGIYTVCLTVTDSCGSSTACEPVEIVCIPPVAGFTYNFLYPDILFSDTSVSNAFISRLWDFGDGTTSTEQNPVHSYDTVQGTFTVCLIITDSCGSDEFCAPVTNILPLMTHFTASNAVANDKLVQFRDETEGATSWSWDFGDGGSSGLQNPSHLYADYGNYNVCLTAGNGYASVSWCDSLKLSKAIIPDGTNRVLVFPNPASAVFYFQTNLGAASATVELTDLTGNSVRKASYSNVLAGIPKAVDISGIAYGTYLVKLDYDDYSVTWKLVIY